MGVFYEMKHEMSKTLHKDAKPEVEILQLHTSYVYGGIGLSLCSQSV